MAARIILLIVITFSLLISSIHPVEASSPAGPVSGIPAAPGSEAAAPSTRPEPAARSISDEPVVQAVVGLVAVLFGLLAVLPLFVGSAEGCTRERIET